MLEHAERLAKLGSWEWGPEDGTVVWSDNLFRIYGFEPNEIVPTIDCVMEIVHPEDVARFERETELVLRTKRTRPPFEFRIVRPDGSTRFLRSSISHVERGDINRFVGLVEDRSGFYHSESEIAAHVAVIHALNHWESLEVGGLRLLENLGLAMHFDRGALWVPTGDLLEARLFWHSRTPSDPALQAEIEGTRLPRGVGVAGKAWERRAPVTVADATADHTYAFRREAERDSLRGAIAFPAVVEGEVIAVFGFASKDEIALTDRLNSCLVSLGVETGSFLARHQADMQPPLLSPRELQVLQLAADGHQGPEIAERLGIGVSTIKTHFEHIYDKLEVTDRGNAVAAGLRRGLID